MYCFGLQVDGPITGGLISGGRRWGGGGGVKRQQKIFTKVYVREGFRSVNLKLSASDVQQRRRQRERYKTLGLMSENNRSARVVS